MSTSGRADIFPAYFNTKFVKFGYKIRKFWLNEQSQVIGLRFERLQNQPFNCTQLSQLNMKCVQYNSDRYAFSYWCTLICIILNKYLDFHMWHETFFDEFRIAC